MSGGSIASLVCLSVARPRAFERVGHDPARDGVATGGRVYASSQVHHVVTRAAAVLGLGRHSVTSIEVDDRWCIRVDALRERLARDRRAGVLPVAIVATAGTVNTGAVDSIGELVDLAAEFGPGFMSTARTGSPVASTSASRRGSKGSNGQTRSPSILMGGCRRRSAAVRHSSAIVGCSAARSRSRRRVPRGLGELGGQRG